MRFLDSLNDDQVALLGCATALLLCGSAMVISYTLSRWIAGKPLVSHRFQRRQDVARDDAPNDAGIESDQRTAA